MEDNFTSYSMVLTPERIRSSRIASNLTEKELAEAAGVTPASIIAYESGKPAVSEEIAETLAEVPGVQLDSTNGEGSDTESEVSSSPSPSSSILDLHKKEIIDFLADRIRVISQFNEDELYQMETEMEQIITDHEEGNWKYQLCSDAPLLNSCKKCKINHHGECPAENIKANGSNPCFQIWKEIAAGRQ